MQAIDPLAADAETQAKILTALLDPELRQLPVVAICDQIGISRATWYRHRSEPSFRQRFSALCTEALTDHVAPVLSVLATSAALPGRDGHPDRKLFLEVAGMYQPASRVQVEGAGGERRAAADLTDEQLVMAFEGREQLLPVGVLRRLGRDPDLGFDQANAAKPAPDPAGPTRRRRK